MGQNNASGFRDQFTALDINRASQTKFWHMYDATTLQPISRYSNGTAAAGALPPSQHGDLNIDTSKKSTPSPQNSPLGSPLQRSGSFSSSRRGSRQNLKKDSQKGVIASGSKVTVWQVNVTHNAYTAAISGPNRRAQGAAGAGSRWHPTRTSMEKLVSLTHGGSGKLSHPNLMPIYTCDIPQGETNTLFGISEGTYQLAITVLNQLSPTELLYGLLCISQALSYLHSKGIGHFNLSWDSVYIKTSSNRMPWVLFDPHFMAGIGANLSSAVADARRCSLDDGIENGSFGDQATVAAASVATGAQDLVALLRDIVSLRDAKQLPFVAPEVKNPDISDFIQPGAIAHGDVYSFGVLIEQLISEGKISSLGKGSTGSLRAISDQLKTYSKNCLKKEASKRPTLASFAQLECVQRSAFVSSMAFLDRFREVTDVEKTKFFWTLHLDVMKLPYEQFLHRLLPRLLSIPLWDDSAAEPFLEQLLTPIRKVPNEALPAPTPEQCFGVGVEAEGGAASSPKNGRASGKGSTSSLIPPGYEASLSGVPLVGVVMHQDYATFLGRFIKAALGRVSENQLTCVLMRHIDKFVANIDFGIVTEHVIPTLIANLTHPCTDVVYEALRGFTSVARSVFAAAERGADVGRARDDLIRAYGNQIFNLAAADTNLQVRMMALKLVVRTLKGSSMLLPRNKAMIAISCCLTAPVVVKTTWKKPPSLNRSLSGSGSFTFGSAGGGGFATTNNFTLVTALSIAHKTLDLITMPELLRLLTPAEIVLMIMPALFQLSQGKVLGAEQATEIAEHAIELKHLGSQSSAMVAMEDLERTTERIQAADRLLRYKALQYTLSFTTHVAERPDTGNAAAAGGPVSQNPPDRAEDEEDEQEDEDGAETDGRQRKIRGTGGQGGWSEAMDNFFQQEEAARREGWVSFPDLNLPNWGPEGGKWLSPKVRKTAPLNPYDPVEFYYKHPNMAFETQSNVPLFNHANRSFDADWVASGILSSSKAMMTNGINVPSVGQPSSRPHPAAGRLPGPIQHDAAVAPVTSTTTAGGGLAATGSNTSFALSGSASGATSFSLIAEPSSNGAAPAPGGKKKPKKKRSTIKLDGDDDLTTLGAGSPPEVVHKDPTTQPTTTAPTDNEHARQDSVVSAQDSEPKTPAAPPLHLGKKVVPTVGVPMGRKKQAASVLGGAQNSSTFGASPKGANSRAAAMKKPALTEDDIDL